MQANTHGHPYPCRDLVIPTVVGYKDVLGICVQECMQVRQNCGNSDTRNRPEYNSELATDS